MYDLIILGAGPAGITAGVYAARKKMNLLVITEDVGGQASLSGDIENYTGYQFVSGPELVAKFEEHMKKYAIQLKENEKALSLRKIGSLVEIKTSRGIYQAKSAIIATGKSSRELKVPGESKLKNKGLTYCATCDGPLFAGKEVAVIGGANSALDAALQLSRICSEVYIVNINPALEGDSIMRGKIEQAENVSLLNNSRVTEIIGENMVSGIKIDKQGEEQTLSVQGVFVEIGLIPNSAFTVEVEKNEIGEIKVNSYNRTNIPGIFAAGDVTDVPEKQIIIAAGEGAKATLSAFRYLAQHKL